ncbi:MAG: glutamate racemase, partial [Granulosicoccus sp.]|nr:glutamate racemase [Granulosicoccus sp.]
VLVFDSGIGGLSVMREARLLMHDHRFVYVGDDAGFPYGEWEEAALTQRMVELFETLIDTFNPKLAIVACNTASTMIMPALRARFSIPFVGIVPAIKPAAERTASGMFTVLATPGTVARSYTKKLIEEYASDCDVNLVGATQLARLAEDHMQLKEIDTRVLESEISPCFVEKNGKRTDIITVGCTHYPFLVDEMRKLAPWPVDWLDPAQAVARQAKRVLDKLDSAPINRKDASVKDDIAIMTSGTPPYSVVRLLASMGMRLEAFNFSSLQLGAMDR